MKKDSISSKKIIRDFISYFVYVKHIYYSYSQIFEDKNFVSSLIKHSNDFNCELNDIYVRMLFLLQSTVMDPASSINKKQIRNNLTLNYIIESIEWSAIEKEELLKIKDRCNAYYKIIKLPRDRIIAHTDYSVFQENKALGSFSNGLDKKFMEDIELFCNKTHEYIFGEICGDIVVSLPGDVQSFKKIFQYGVKVKEFIEMKDNVNKELRMTLIRMVKS